MTTIAVREMIRPADDIAGTAHRVAELAVDHFRRNELPVIVSLRGVRGVPSTFFNAMLMDLRGEFGDAGMENVRFEFDSDRQRETYERALHAANS